MNLVRKFILSFLALLCVIITVEIGMPENSLYKLPIIIISAALFLILSVNQFFEPFLEIVSLAENIRKGAWRDKASFVRDDELGDLAESLYGIGQILYRQFNDLEGERTKFHALLSSMIDGLIILDERQEIEFLNPQAERALRIKSLEARGKPLFSVWPLKEVQKIISDSLRDLTVMSDEISLPYNVLKLYVVPMAPVTGASVMLVFRDITELRRLEEMRNKFLGQVSHELRTPLTIVKGYVITLMDDPRFKDASDVQKNLLRIEQESDRLRDLVEELLDFSNLRSGRSALTFAPLSFSDLVADTVDGLRSHAERYQIELELKVVGDIPLIIGDTRQLKQVLINLLDNAIKYSPAGEKVEVFLTKITDGILLRISDNGSGIPSEDLPHVFENFFQGKKRSEGKGWGLGLPIVKGIIDAHGGEIKIENKESHGAVVIVVFPYSGEDFTGNMSNNLS